jgi:predicted dinucleotide-binding enzyme
MESLMQYSIIGSGAIGHAVATQFARSGLDLSVANSRGPQALAELARELGPHIKPVSVGTALEAAVCILAVPFTVVPELVSGVGDWKGRTVVDATNAIQFPEFVPLDLGGRPSTAVLSDALRGARVVKAFNTLPAAVLQANPSQDGGKRVLFISGDDAPANDRVKNLADELGFAPVLLGPLAHGGLLQQFGGPLVGINLIKHTGPTR